MCSALVQFSTLKKEREKSGGFFQRTFARVTVNTELKNNRSPSHWHAVTNHLSSYKLQLFSIMFSALFGLLWGISLAQWVGLAVVLASYAYWWLTRYHGQWEAKGLPSLKPSLVFGNEADLYMGKKSFVDHYIDVYKKNKHDR